MVKTQDFDPVKYLVDRKFGRNDYEAGYSIKLSAERAARNQPEVAEQIEKYRKQLEQMSPDQLNKLVHDEALKLSEAEAAKRDAEERARFFNRPDANADFDHWSKLTFWKLDEAIALSFGKAPERVRWEDLKEHVRISPFAAQYGKRRELAIRAHAFQQLDDPVLPPNFLVWAKRMEIELPAQLIAGVEKTGVQVADWRHLCEQAMAHAQHQSAMLKEMDERKRSEIIELRRRVEELDRRSKAQMQEPIAPRERESLLRLVIGMAVIGYGYDPRSTRSRITAEIAGDLDVAGVAMDADTVRKYLKEAAGLLPQQAE